jgi:hypothetical protein
MIGPCPAGLAASKLPAAKRKTRTDLIRLLILGKEQIEDKPLGGGAQGFLGSIFTGFSGRRSGAPLRNAGTKPESNAPRR